MKFFFRGCGRHLDPPGISLVFPGFWGPEPEIKIPGSGSTGRASKIFFHLQLVKNWVIFTNSLFMCQDEHENEREDEQVSYG